MGLKRHVILIITVGVLLGLLTCSVYAYENYYYTGEKVITGKLIGARNKQSSTPLCYLELSDGKRIWVPLNGITNDTIGGLVLKNVIIYYSQTVTGKCRLLSISEVS